MVNFRDLAFAYFMCVFLESFYIKSHRTVSSQCNCTINDKLIIDIFMTITMMYVKTVYKNICLYCFAKVLNTTGKSHYTVDMNV